MIRTRERSLTVDLSTIMKTPQVLFFINNMDNAYTCDIILLKVLHIYNDVEPAKILPFNLKYVRPLPLKKDTFNTFFLPLGGTISVFTSLLHTAHKQSLLSVFILEFIHNIKITYPPLCLQWPPLPDSGSSLPSFSNRRLHCRCLQH